VVAAAAATIGVALFVRGAHDLSLLRSADPEAIDICVSTPSMDCDPRHWWRNIGVGSSLILASVVLVARWSSVRRGR
jgi:hypothetical protein